jgi:hypothetical protein
MSVNFFTTLGSGSGVLQVLQAGTEAIQLFGLLFNLILKTFSSLQLTNGPNEHFQPSLIFASKARSYSSGAVLPSKAGSWPYPRRLHKSLPGTNISLFGPEHYCTSSGCHTFGSGAPFRAGSRPNPPTLHKSLPGTNISLFGPEHYCTSSACQSFGHLKTLPWFSLANSTFLA